MIRLLRRLLSLKNLVDERTSARGQVATYMLLMLGAALIFVIAMASLGNLASRTTTIDDAADAASLMLAARLANKAHLLWQSLGNRTEKCQGTGFLGNILMFIILIIIIIIVLIFCAPCAIAVGAVLAGTATVGATVAVVAGAVVAGAVAGAAGGAIGGAVDGSGAGAGAARGALTGAQVGLALGGGAALGGLAAGSLFGAGGALVDGAAAMAPGTSLTVGQVIGLGAVSGINAVSIGAAAGAALTTVATGYNMYVANQMKADAFAAAAKATQGLPEEKAFRESVFFSALTKVVDDPNMTILPGTDPNVGGCHWWGPEKDSRLAKQIGDRGAHYHPILSADLDGDGDVDEQLPCFLVWWHRREYELKQGALGATNLPNVIKNFIKGGEGVDSPLEEFRRTVKRKYTYSGATEGDPDSGHWGPFSREEVEGVRGDLDGDGKSECADRPPARCNGNNNGLFIRVAQRLSRTGDPNFMPTFCVPAGHPMCAQLSYQPDHPDWAELRAWNNSIASCAERGCTARSLPPGFDQVDQLIWEMQDFVDMSKMMKEENKDFLATAIDAWLPFYYNPDSTSDLYDRLWYRRDAHGLEIGWVGKLVAWRNELIAIRNRFPKCSDVAQVRPCKRWSNAEGGWIYESADGVRVRFGRTINKINHFIDRIKRFRNQIKKFYDKVQDREADLADSWGGGGRKVIYRWEDSRGPHWVEVRISKYLIPEIDVDSGFLETCMKLENYEDRTGKNTWVRITRHDNPKETRLFNFGETLNFGNRDLEDPDDDGLGPVVGGISKKSKALYGLIPGDRNNPAYVRNAWFVRLRPKQPGSPKPSGGAYPDPIAYK